MTSLITETDRADRSLPGSIVAGAALLLVVGTGLVLHARSSTLITDASPPLVPMQVVANSAAVAVSATAAAPKVASDAELLALAEASLRKREYDSAQAVIATLQAPDAPEALRVRGMLLELASKLDQALALYDRAIPQLDKPLLTMERKARVLSWLERFEDSAAVYREIVASPAADVALKQRSRARLAELTAWNKDFDGALAQLAALLAEDPTVPEALLVQGQVLEWQGRYPEAKRSYSSLLAVDPSHAEARLRLNNLLWVK